MHQTSILFLSFSLLIVAEFYANGQASTESAPDSPRRIVSTEGLRALKFTTLAYQREALKLLLEEANRVARELHLPEIMPITISNLTAAYIPPPRLAEHLQALGNVTTSNYTYYVSVGNKFSFLTKRNLDADYDRLQEEFLWPVNRMDTNGAYQLATQMLATVSMDVEALNRDCAVHVMAFAPQGVAGKYFVPLYWVYWEPTKGARRGCVAEVELFAPTKTIRQLHVNDAAYILRRPLIVQNLDKLLSDTNAPAANSSP